MNKRVNDVNERIDLDRLLGQPFTQDEVSDAINKLHTIKASGQN